MARETKVGLLAGLAFIVGFAVILTNNGQQGHYRTGAFVTQASPDVGRSRTALPLPIDAPDRIDTRPRRHPASPTRFATPRQEAREPSMPEWRRPLPTAEDNPRNSTAGGSPDSSSAYRQDRAADAHGYRPAPTSLSSNLPEANRSRSDDRHDRATSTIGSDSPGASTTADRAAVTSPEVDLPPPPMRRNIAPPSESGANARPLTRYVVAPGDTLTRIAFKHYGAGSRQYVNAIVDANRSVIADPDVLRSGTKLVIPHVLGATPTVGAPPAMPGERYAGSAANGRDANRWYQIAPNDRYITIAREQLGDAERWREIFELNRDKFPDPGRIRPGVRIKLPAVHPAAGEGGR